MYCKEIIMYNNKTVTALIAAGGSGNRMNSDIPKQFMLIEATPIIAKTLLAFQNDKLTDNIVIVSRPDDIEKIQEIIKTYKIEKVTDIVSGGKTRQLSIINGLNKVTSDIVLIHDAARPFVSQAQIDEVIKSVDKNKAAALGIPISDTLKLSNNGKIVKTIDRNGMYAIQTPQGFDTKLIKAAHENATKNNISVTDDCSVAEAMGIDVFIVNGSARNIKITNPDDIIIANAINRSEDKKMQIGMGYDVHKLCKDRDLILGGVKIDYELGLLGHSDADVLLHAIMDAMLGATALGDIGKHFPDTDEKYKDADSRKLLHHTKSLLNEIGASVNNIDATIIAQAPKLLPYIDAMRKNIADDLNLPLDKVSVKATTTEKLGFCGRGEGIAAEAICLIEM